jgi:hypothetical protein
MRFFKFFINKEAFYNIFLYLCSGLMSKRYC